MQKITRYSGQPEIARIIFFGLTVFLGFIAVMKMPRVSIPFGFAYILSLISKPVMSALIKLGLNKLISIAIILGGLGFFASYPVVNVVPKLIEESKNVESYLPKIERRLREGQQKAAIYVKENTGIDLKPDILDGGIEWGQTAIKNFLLAVPKFLTSALEWVLLVPLFMFFILQDGQSFKNGFLRIVPNSFFERTYFLVHQFNKQLGDYIFAKFIEASIIGTICTIGCLVIGLPFAFLLGITAGVTNIIPYLGPVLGAVPALVVAAMQPDPQTYFGATLLLYLIANLFDLALVFPILVSKIVDLHPMLVVVSVIFGSQAWGVVGMIISIPVAAICKLIVGETYRELYTTRSGPN
jgi:putative permease